METFPPVLVSTVIVPAYLVMHLVVWFQLRERWRGADRVRAG